MGIKMVTSPVQVGGVDYETVAVSQTDQVLGDTGGFGDLLSRLVINTITAATASVTITDGTTAIVIQTAGTPVVGVRVIELGIRAVIGPWKVTTGAGATVIAIGQFSV